MKFLFLPKIWQKIITLFRTFFTKKSKIFKKLLAWGSSEMFQATLWYILNFSLIYQ